MCVWVEDADNLDINSSELGVLYANRTIQSYLSSSSGTLGLAAVKGQGKTFLIKVKRKKIVESDKGIICLPHDRMVDSIDSSLQIDASLYNYLVDYNVWVNLWKYSICVTLIQHSEIDTNIDEMALDSETRRQIKYFNPNFTPSLIFCNMLRLNVKNLHRALQDTGKLMDVIGRIHNGICIFFDKIDQGLTDFFTANLEDSRMPVRSRKTDFWVYGQYSLAETAYDIASKNKHIKVYYTIRQETLTYDKIPNRNKARNILANITFLKYSKSDLLQMYKIYIENEDDDNLIYPEVKSTLPSKAFLGMEEIEHGYIFNTSENVFDYIYRHSFHRPYDFMRICRQLYLDNAKETEQIRHIVNKHSDEILHMYLKELELFIPFSIPEIEELIKNVPGNIIDQDIIHMVCSAFFHNVKDTNGFCGESCESCEYSNPFSVLYSIGLVGKQKQNPADKLPKQDFMNIGDGVSITPLPRSDYYFMHPSISNFIRGKRKDQGLPFNLNQNIIVGDGCLLNKSQIDILDKYIKECKDIFQKQRIFVSSTVNDLKNIRQTIRNHLINRWLIPVMSDYADFNLKNAKILHSHDICLFEVATCKNLIFILGMEYGGEYAGIKFSHLIEDIKNSSGGKIEKPSISLMEFYVAKTLEIPCYVFRSEEVERAMREKTIDEKLRAEINFINHFSTPTQENVHGNWMYTYSSDEQLVNMIDSIKFFE